MRLLHYVAEQRDPLKASRASEAEAVAAAERGRLGREMHDVLAHSLSALTLQLDATRVLARDRGVSDDIAQSIDRAHHLAASGLDEAPPADVGLTGGYGLTGMRERAELLGGELLASPTPRGFRVELRLPGVGDRRPLAARTGSGAAGRRRASRAREPRHPARAAARHSTSDGEEALALADEHSPDVVLMDLRLPRLDGIEATRRLHERRPDVRVIALTTLRSPSGCSSAPPRSSPTSTTC